MRLGLVESGEAEESALTVEERRKQEDILGFGVELGM